MLKAIFKLFFNKSFREAWALRYESYGTIRKVLVLLLITALTAGAIVCELISFSLYKTNVGLGIITSILFIAIGTLAFRFSLFFAGVALNMAFNGSTKAKLFSPKKKEEKDLNETPTENTETTQTTPENDNTAENGEIVEHNKKQNRALDFIIGILGFVYAIGVIVALVWILIARLQSLTK